MVELFGHQRIAGRVSEATIGGCSFLRVDVPATEGRPPYSKYFGNGAIYAMTPCDEEIARHAAAQIERYSAPLPVQMPKALGAAAAAEVSQAELAEDLAEEDDGDDFDGDAFDD